VATSKAQMTEAERKEIRARNRLVLEQYMGSGGTPWWEDGAAEVQWFSDDFRFQIPFAQKGLPTMHSGADHRDFFRYLYTTVKSFDVKWGMIHDLYDPYAFWMEYYGDGECTWGKGGFYEQLEVTFVRVNEAGKLTRYVEHFDPTRVWENAGLTIPVFDYNKDRLRSGLPPHVRPKDTLVDYIEHRRTQDPGDEAAIDVASMSDKEIADMRERNRGLLNRYMGGEGLGWWQEGAVEAGYFSDDFVIECPNAFPGCAHVHPAGEWQEHLRWLNRTVLRLDVLLECVYETVDPYSFWLEYYVDGAVSWGKGGPYDSLVVAFIRLDEKGRLKRYREHSDPTRVLEASGAWRVPTFDYNEDRKRNGLPPHDMVLPTREDYLRERLADAARGLQL
jgi:ketosteroid isomerase-like protein